MVKVLKNLLSDKGYNLIELPKEDIAPLLLLYKNGNDVSSVESPVQRLFKTGDSAPPVIIKDKIVIDVEGVANITYDANGGVEILDWLLKKLNMGQLAGKLKLDGTNTVKICYEDVTEDKVSLLDLDNFITMGQPDITGFHTFKEKLQDSELYIVTAILKSNTFSVVVEDENGQQVNVDATIKGVLDARVDISHNKNNAITLKHEGIVPLAFAFKAQQILYNQKQWWQFFKSEEADFHLKDLKGTTLKSEVDFPTSPLVMDTTSVNI